MNWKTNQTTDFVPGDIVSFDDSVGTVGGLHITAVTISGSNVTPGSVTFNNNIYPYSVSGPFGITSVGALTLNGSGRVTLNTSASFAGGTVVNAGLLAMGGSGSLQTSSLGIAGTASIAAGGSVTANGGTTVNAAALLNVGSGSLQTTTLQVSGIAGVGAGGSATANGGTTVNATGLLAVSGGSLQTTTLNISGTASFGPGSSLATSGTVSVYNLGVLSLGTSGFALPAVTVNPGGALAGSVANAFAISAGTVIVNGQLQVAADGALHAISSKVIMGVESLYNFTAPQSTSPNLTIPAGMGLFGNLTNFTYGSTGSVSLAVNSTLWPTAGNLPTRAQLGGSAILLQPVLAADSGSNTVGDDGSTSIYKGVSLGSWTTVGGVPIAPGLPFTASNGNATFNTLPAVNFTGTITDSSTNGFTFYLNGQNIALGAAATLNTTNTTRGVEFDGLGNVTFPTATGGTAGAIPGGTATNYSRVGVFDALNTSGGTLPNTTNNETLILLPSVMNNLAGKALNLQNLTVNADDLLVPNPNIPVNWIASNGTLNFGAYSAMNNQGVAFTQGTFNFAPTSIYRIGNDARLTSGATWNFQTGSMVSIAYAPNTDAWKVPSNVDLVLSSNTNPDLPTGATGIVLGDGRTLSSPWNTSAIALDLSASTTLNAAPGAASIRLAGANGQTLTVNGPLELGSATLVINDTPTFTLYVPANGDGDFTRQPGGSVLNGTVLLGNTFAATTPSVIPAVWVKGGTLRLSQRRRWARARR